MKHYHFIGIGGIGMAGLASLMLEKGCKVTGSDIKFSALTSLLSERGAVIYEGHDASYVKGADVIVYSSAIKDTNSERQQAVKEGAIIQRRAELLAELMKDEVGVTIAGAHGKTTTSAIAFHLLKENGFSPTGAIGGIMKGVNVNAVLGDGHYFVAEVDESDGTFLQFCPQYSIITNYDVEHLDHYGSEQALQDAYKSFISNTKPDGALIICGDDKKLLRLVENQNKRFICYGTGDDNDYIARDIQAKSTGSAFSCYQKDGQLLGKVCVSLPGKHNVLNALSCVVLGIKMNIAFDRIVESVNSFNGVQRRFQILGKVNGATIVDDYAHHPTEIIATLQAAAHVSSRRKIVVFQPHRFSRVEHMWQEFSMCFKQSDQVIVTDIYTAGEDPIEGVTAERLAEAIADGSHNNVSYVKRSDLTSFLNKILKDGDLVLMLGAGDISTLAHSFVQEVQMKSTV